MSIVNAGKYPTLAPSGSIKVSAPVAMSAGPVIEAPAAVDRRRRSAEGN